MADNRAAKGADRVQHTLRELIDEYGAELVVKALADLTLRPEAYIYAHLMHDLRNATVPLAFDLANLKTRLPELFEGTAAPASDDEFVALVERLCIGAALLDDFLLNGLAVVRTANVEAEDSFAPNAVIADVVRLFQHPQKLPVSLGSLPEAHTAVHRGSFVRVLMNLLRNAHDAAMLVENGQVRVQGWDTPDCIFVEVSDNGPGIEQAEKSSIFALFESGRVGGSGVGLHACRVFVDHWGGDLRLRSVPYKNTVFTFSMPRV